MLQHSVNFSPKSWQLRVKEITNATSHDTTPLAIVLQYNMYKDGVTLMPDMSDQKYRELFYLILREIQPHITELD
jgi:hypothetical protein